MPKASPSRAYTCAKCGSVFSVPGSQAAARERRGQPPQYCSRACHAAASVCNRVGTKCDRCGKSFTKRRDHLTERNFCSKTCFQLSRRTPGPWSETTIDRTARREYFRLYVAKNRDRINGQSRQFQRSRRTYKNFIQQQRRAAGNLTYEEWQAFIAEAGECAHCGSRDYLQVDHIIAIAKGGRTERGNLQVLCKPCNISKGTRPFPLRPGRLGIAAQ